METNFITVHSEGIFHGLPALPADLKGLKAIICGANGISGHHAHQVLSQNPGRWSKIYCLSRRPPAIPGDMTANTEHIAVDLLSEPAAIAELLRKHNIEVDYVFFYAYAHIVTNTDNPEDYFHTENELCRVNGSLIRNFLEALKLASLKPKGILLQTGGKSYGGHNGPFKVPMEEWDPRFTRGAANFYHDQEDILWKYCKEQDVNWSITMPMTVLGAVPDSGMNMCFVLAVYASVCKHLNEPLAFPGDRFSWQCLVDQSSATLSGYLAEWALLSGKANNEKLNSVDGTHFTYETFWPRFASLYDVPYEGPSDEGITEVEYGLDPPPRGYGPKGKVGFKFTLLKWSDRPEVQQAWREIAAQNGLVHKELPHRSNFGFGDWVIFRREPVVAASMTKARKRGWLGFVDSTESHLHCFKKLAELKMIPELPKREFKLL